MTQQIILGTKDPNSFANKRVIITKGDTGYNARILEPAMNFGELLKLRKTQTTAEKVLTDLASTGYIAANLGVSVVLTMDYDGTTYTLAVKQDRLDLGDTVAKLVSGYVHADNLATPRDAIDEEIAEEILPITREKQAIRFTREGIDLKTPFDFINAPDKINLHRGSKYTAPDLAGPVLVEEKPIADEPCMYFQLPSNSAQLVWEYHLEFPDLDLNAAGVSLHHSEDKFNPQRGLLEVILHSDALYLIALQNGNLTDHVSVMSDGKRISVDPRRVVLSEAFAPKEEGIVTMQNIALMDYLKR